MNSSRYIDMVFLPTSLSESRVRELEREITQLGDGIQVTRRTTIVDGDLGTPPNLKGTTMLFLNGTIAADYQTAVESYLRTRFPDSYICRVQDEMVPVQVFRDRPEIRPQDDIEIDASML
ncbi:hypothetical protein HYX06_06785 [Candidatus Woesearchaeota archaeon]|nr:hypothetical protein [Candidatus Woesearchaeota archaeon]